MRAVFALAFLGLPNVAFAHIQLISPPPRYADQKEGPCGRGATDQRTTHVTPFTPGQTITITFRETVPHPGHYRISFDADGQDDFEDPTSYTDFYTNAAVIMDDIPDLPGTNPDPRTYSIEVTLPNVTCQNCTLQVVQVMTDKPPYAPGTNDLYYQCADLILENTHVDAGIVADFGTSLDAQLAIDVSGDPIPPDAEVLDVGVRADAGARMDAGSTMSNESGCQCVKRQTGLDSAIFLLAALFILSRSQTRESQARRDL